MSSTTHPCLRGTEAVLAELCGFPPYLRIVAISDPGGPATLGSHSLTQCQECCTCTQGLAVSGDCAYVSIYEAYFWVHGGRWIYSHRLDVVDISDPLAPREMGKIYTDYPGPVSVGNGLALLCLDDGRVQAVDVRVPTNPLGIGEIQLPGKLRDILISGDLAYVAAGSAGLVILGIGPLGLMVAGQVTTEAGAGVSGVTLQLTGDAAETVTTPNSGRYRFDELEAGAYTIIPSKPDYVFTPSVRVYDNLTSDQLMENFVGAPRLHVIAGTVASGWGSPIGGVRVEIAGAITGADTTDTEGAYRFEGLLRGSYEIAPVKDGWRFSPASRVYPDLMSDSLDQGFTGQWIGFGIRGRVMGPGDQGIEGVAVELAGDAHMVYATDGAGCYSFTGVAGGSYRIIPAKPNWVFQPAAREYPELSRSEAGQGYVGTVISFLRVSQTGQGSVRIEALSEHAGTVEIEVFTVAGRVLWQGNLALAAAQPSALDWNCENAAGRHVSPGVYVLRVSGAGLDRTAKIVVAR